MSLLESLSLRLKKPWLWIPTKMAHDMGPLGLKFITAFTRAEKLVFESFEWRGLKFRHRLGLAGGVDKTGISIPSWWKLDAGFAEIGTITPKPQGPNPGVIIKRDVARQALWNKMGFPNEGVDVLKKTVSKFNKPYETPLFINIGKNRDTPNEKAVDDYVHCLRETRRLADAFVVNISSPNTKNLRALQGAEALTELLTGIQQANLESGSENAKPILLKISPDISDSELEEILQISIDRDLDGWILTNTTQDRSFDHCFPTEGGISGRPLADRSLKVLKNASQFLSAKLGDHRKEKLLISVGGVLSKEDYKARRDAGADLVQVYAALVFEGPFFFKKVVKSLIGKKNP